MTHRMILVIEIFIGVVQFDWYKLIAKDFKIIWSTDDAHNAFVFISHHLLIVGDCVKTCLHHGVDWVLKISEHFLIAVSANYLTKIGPAIGYHAHECRSWASHSTTIEERVEMPATGAFNRAFTTSWNVLVGYLLFYITWWCK